MRKWAGIFSVTLPYNTTSRAMMGAALIGEGGIIAYGAFAGKKPSQNARRLGVVTAAGATCDDGISNGGEVCEEAVAIVACGGGGR